jgi:hypothetical protein
VGLESEGDRLLAAAVSARLKSTVSPRQVRRLREDGLILTSPRRYPGRGSQTIHSEAAIDRAVAATIAMRRRRHAGRAALDLIAVGQPVQPKALITYLDDLEQSITSAEERAGARLGDEPPHPLDQAWYAMRETLDGLLRTAEGRRWRKRLRRRWQALRAADEPVESVGSSMEGAVANLYAVALTGETSSPDSLDELLNAAGVYALRDEKILGRSIVKELDIGRIQRDLRRVRLAALRDAVRNVSPEELHQAHQDAAFLIRVSRAATAVGQNLFPGSDAAGFAPVTAAADAAPGMLVLMMLIVRTHLGAAVDEWRSEVGSGLAQLEAQALVIDRVRPELRRYMEAGVGAARLAALPQEERERVHQEFRQIVEALPPDIREQTGFDQPG